jgi:hypothetical protein
LRILCLLAAATIVAAMTYRDLPAALPLRPHRVPPLRTAVWIAAALAAGQLIAALWVEQFERRGQLFYLALLLAPAVLLRVSYGRDARSHDRGLLLGLGALAAVWAGVRLALAWDSPRSADAVDMFSAFTFLEQTDNAGLNILTSALGPIRGVSYLFLVFHGAGLYGPEGILTRTLHLLQIINVVWTGVVAVGLGWIAARAFGRTAAPIAAAVFLCSPYMLIGALVPTPMYHAVLVATGLIVLWMHIHERRSPPAIAAFGTLAGVGCSHPGTLPFTVFISAAALWSATRPPKLPGRVHCRGAAVFCRHRVSGVADRHRPALDAAVVHARHDALAAARGGGHRPARAGRGAADALQRTRRRDRHHCRRGARAAGDPAQRDSALG